MGDGGQAALHNAAVVDTHNVRRCGTFKVDVESLDVNEERSSIIIRDDEGRELWLRGIDDNTVCVNCSDTDYLAHSATVVGEQTLAETSAERLEEISSQLRPGSVVTVVFGPDAIRSSNCELSGANGLYVQYAYLQEAPHRWVHQGTGNCSSFEIPLGEKWILEERRDKGEDDFELVPIFEYAGDHSPTLPLRQSWVHYQTNAASEMKARTTRPLRRPRRVQRRWLLEKHDEH